MKRLFVLFCVALMLLSGFGSGIWADEEAPPPQPGLDEGGPDDNDGPEDDDNPWGGEERSSGDPGNGFITDLDLKPDLISLTCVTGIPVIDLWYGYYSQRLLESFEYKNIRPLRLAAGENTRSRVFKRSRSSMKQDRKGR